MVTGTLGAIVATGLIAFLCFANVYWSYLMHKKRPNHNQELSMLCGIVGLPFTAFFIANVIAYYWKG